MPMKIQNLIKPRTLHEPCPVLLGTPQVEAPTGGPLREEDCMPLYSRNSYPASTISMTSTRFSIMNPLLRSLLLALLWLAGGVLASQSAMALTPDPERDYEWDETDRTTIIGYKGSRTRLVIPAKAKIIYGGAFEGNTSITDVNMSLSGITDIGWGAFQGCASLGSVVFPESTLQEIGSDAFRDTALESVSIPSSIRRLDWGVYHLSGSIVEGEESVAYSWPFSGCLRLRTINIPPGNKGGYFMRDELLFQRQGADTELVACLARKIGDVAVPDAVKKIRAGAFASTGVITVSIPDTVREIEDMVFFKCPNLKSVRFPENVIFTSTVSFRTDNLPSEGQMTAMFGLCGSLNSITVGNEIRTYGKVSIPSTVTKLGRGAFLGCEYIESVALPDGLTAIGHQAFQKAIRLSSINIPRTVKYIDGSVFAWCTNLNRIQVDPLNPKFSSPAAGVVTSKNRRKLVAASSYFSVVVPNTVKAIGDRAYFANISNGLTDDGGRYTLPDNIEIIGSEAFINRIWGVVKTVTVGSKSKLASIGTAAFYEPVPVSFTVPTVMKPKLFSWTASEPGLGLNSLKEGMLAYEPEVEMFFPVARPMVYDQRNVPNQRYANNAFFKLERVNVRSRVIRDTNGENQTYDSYRISFWRTPTSAVHVGSYWIKRQTAQWRSVGASEGASAKQDCAILPWEFGESPNVFGCLGNNGGGSSYFGNVSNGTRFGIYSHDPKAPRWLKESLDKCSPAALNKVSIGLFYPKDF
jgi:hypothetical protein